MIFVFVFVLLISVGTGQQPPERGTQSLEYSLQSSKRMFACPQESVSYSCVTFGSNLEWDVSAPNRQSSSLAAFGTDDSAGAGFSNRDVDGYCFIFSGVLDGLLNVTGQDVPLCYSTLTVTPGRFRNGTLDVVSCIPKRQIDLFNVSCSVGGNYPPKSLPYRLSAMPTQPRILSCVYNLSQWSVEATLDASDEGTDLDYFKVKLNISQNDIVMHLEEHLAKVTESTGHVISLFTLASQFTNEDLEAKVNVTAVDKCGQESSQSSFVCMIVGGNAGLHCETTWIMWSLLFAAVVTYICA